MDRSSLAKAKLATRLHSIGRAKSCTCCRQAKVACDARKTRTGQCSRCRLKQLDCRFDANFKRIATRRITEEIRQELQALRSSEDASYANPPFRETVTSSQNISIGNTPASVRPDRGQASPWLNITDSDSACSYALGTLNLDAETSIALFQYFAWHYYPHAKFLQPITSLSDLLARSPLLFWTIVLIASREHDRFTAVSHEVAAAYEGLLSPILGKAIQRIETIHALLLVCLWPLPQSQYFHNPAWNYVGLAIHAALQLQCNSPLSSGGRQNMWPGFGLVPECEVDEVDQAWTWLGCFRVGTLIATISGFPSPIMQQHMKSVDEALNNMSNHIPQWWKILITILKITVSAIDTLSNIDNHALHFSTTEIFNEQLDKLKQANHDTWRPELEIEWCNTKLHIFALTFTMPANTDPNQDPHWRIRRQMILLKAFDAASSLVTHFPKLGQDHVSDLHPNGLLRTVPEPYFTFLFNATTFLFRFMATFMAITPTQRNKAMGLIIESHKIFYSFPGRRELTRAAIHIEALIDTLKQGVPFGMSELTVKNKLGASVMFDAVFHACRQRNIDSRTGKPLAMQQWKTVTETFAERLPETDIPKLRSEARKYDSGIDDAEQHQQFIAVTELNTQWWGEWDNYINLNQIGDEQLDMI